MASPTIYLVLFINFPSEAGLSSHQKLLEPHAAKNGKIRAQAQAVPKKNSLRRNANTSNYGHGFQDIVVLHKP